MPSERQHFIDCSPPDVLWVLADGKPAAMPGRRVAAGEPLAADALAPLRGQVGERRQVIDTSGRLRSAVPLLLDDDAEKLAPPPPRLAARLDRIGRDDRPAWVETLAGAGASADRHNSPDLLAQLRAAEGRPVDSVVCHALEADPTLPLQIQWALRHPAELRDGLRLIARLVGAKHMLLAVAEGEHRRLARLLKRLLAQRDIEPATDVEAGGAIDLPLEKGTEPLGLRLVPTRNTYPQADPTLLAWSLLGRRLRPGALPTEAGVLVLDAVAAVAVGMVARGAAVVAREPVAVRDHGREVSVLAEAWRGSRVGDVLRSLGLIDSAGDGSQTVRSGDYLRANAFSFDGVLDGGELVLHLPPPPPDPPPAVEPCIRCGWCLDICPVAVHPAGVLEAAQRDDAKLAERFGARACVDCGLCEYVCPSRLPLLTAVRLMRKSGG